MFYVEPTLKEIQCLCLQMTKSAQNEGEMA